MNTTLIKFVITILLILFGSISVALAQDTTFSSVVVIRTEKADGTVQTGIGFLTIRDGIAATAWHLVMDAKRVVARFPSGEEFECSGVIDKDPKRNVALIRIKVFGRPLLRMEAADIPAGTKLNIAGVKDSAFGMFPAKIVETASKDGTKWALLEGEIPSANSGSPLLDEQGRVVGILTLRQNEGKVSAYMIPAGFILALDNSLPTTVWQQSSVSQPTPQPAGTITNLEEIDSLIGKAYVILTDNMNIIEWSSTVTKGFGFKNGVSRDVYEFQQNLDSAAGKFADVRTDDPLRQRVIKTLLQMITLQKSSSENYIRSVVIGQQTGIWGAQSIDAFNRSSSFRTALDAKFSEAGADAAELDKQSPRFREYIYPQIRYLLKFAKRPSGYSLGIACYARNQYYLLVVYPNSVADKIGLRPGDTIKSVEGQDFSTSQDIEDFKVFIKKNLGKNLKAVVKRDEKFQNITLKIPKEIPVEALTE